MTLRGEPRWRLCCAVLSSQVASECFRRLNNNDSSQLRRLSASRAPLGDECVVPQSEDNRDFGSRLWNEAGFRRSAPCAHRLPQSRAAHEPDATTATTTAPQIRPPRPQDSPDFELSTGHGDLAVKSRPLPRSAIQRLSTAGCTRPASVPDTPRCSPDPIGVGGPRGQSVGDPNRFAEKATGPSTPPLRTSATDMTCSTCFLTDLQAGSVKAGVSCRGRRVAASSRSCTCWRTHGEYDERVRVGPSATSARV